MYTGYKVPAAEITKDALAYINVKLNTGMHATVPATVIANWGSNPNLNTWQNELLGAGQRPETLTYDDAKVGTSTKKAVSEYLAAHGGPKKSGK